MRLKEFTNNVANWRTIAARNNLANPDLIMPGQVLDVGDGLVLPKGTTYTVKPGDTLSGIAKNIERGKIPDLGSSTTAEPTATVTSPTQTNIPAPNPRKDPGGNAKRSPSVAKPTVAKPPVIDLPNVDPPKFKGGGRGTMPADRNQTPPVADKTKPKRPDYRDPVYDAPVSAPVDQPIPGYKYKDAEKDKAIADKLQKQDRARQKLPPGRLAPNKVPKPAPGTKTSSNEFDTIRGIESGNRDYDDYGRPITSHKGAKFAAQVMPTTNKDPGYGVKPAADAGHEESNRVGKDYFAAMKNKYNDSELAAAAYNAGPGRIDKILQKAKETGRHWKDLLPAETQKYIKKFTGK
jgi:hypothetical protein